MNSPLRFTPFLRPMVWGGRRLHDLLGKPLPTDDLYGESWEISDHPLHRSVVATGPLAGQTLRDLLDTNAPAILGPDWSAGSFPWLVKFLDAADWLSVQVHPDDEAARRLWPGERGKTEAWFVLDAAPGSRVYAGLLPGMDTKRLRAALADGTVRDTLHSFEPKPGDCVFLPAGTVHAVGGGVLFTEVQQTSDATFRLYDWDRRDAQGQSRKLHIDEALACIDWQRGPVRPVRTTGPGEPQVLVTCPYFTLEHVHGLAPFSCGGGRVQVLIVLKGQGQLRGDAVDEAVTAGQVWLLPAVLPELSCVPETEMSSLVCSQP